MQKFLVQFEISIHQKYIVNLPRSSRDSITQNTRFEWNGLDLKNLLPGKYPTHAKGLGWEWLRISRTNK